MEQNLHWIQWFQWIQGLWQITEVWIGVNLKILSLTCVLLSLWLNCGLLHKRWQVRALFNDKYFLSMNSLNSMKTFRKNWLPQSSSSHFPSCCLAAQLALMLPIGCPGVQFTHVVTEPSNHRKTLSTSASVSPSQMVSLEQKVIPLLALIGLLAQQSSFVNLETIFGDNCFGNQVLRPRLRPWQWLKNIHWNSLL